MRAQERVTFILKYFTLRHYKEMEEKNTESWDIKANAEKLKRFNCQRKIEISIRASHQLASPDQKDHKGMSIEIVPLPDIIDRTVKFFKPEKKLIRLQIPSLYELD